MKEIKKKLHLKKNQRKNIQKVSQLKKKKHRQFKPNRPSVIRRNGSSYFQYGNRSYRIPLVLVIATLFTLILIIPSLIAMPKDKDDSTENMARDEIDSTEPESVSVAVMRTQSDVVEDIPLENYIVGVVASEMPANFEMEALKAQALTARTYAVSHLLGGEEEESYDVTDTVQHQVYKNNAELEQQWGSGYEDNLEKIKRAVEATEGEIITFNDEPIMPAYFSMSNGYTENSEDYWENEVPYLRSVPSPWELEHPKLISQETFTLADLEDRLDISLSSASNVEMTVERNESGRVREFTLGEHTFSGREVRDRLELRSSDFSVEEKDDHFIFTTKGYGHGIGMSQYGADAMAKEGKTYEEIIKYYYQEVEISTLDEAAPTLVSK